MHIPYCSGDLWTGTRRTVNTDTFGLYFAGHLIIEGVIQGTTNVTFDLISLFNIFHRIDRQV